jgi:hypothetical protein
MKIKTILVAALLSISFSAAADFTTVAKVHELALSDVRVPATPSSGIVFRTCADCEMQVVRVTPNTLYTLNGKSYPLKEFRSLVFNIRDRANTFVGIKHHLETDVVLSVSVSE